MTAADRMTAYLSALDDLAAGVAEQRRIAAAAV